MSSFPTPRSPNMAATTTAGTMATLRVSRRRIHGRMRRSRNPSITTCPASVPVSVDACPEASNATANTVLASGTPSTGDSSVCASLMSATP